MSVITVKLTDINNMFRRSNPSLTRDDVTNKETMKKLDTLLLITLFMLVGMLLENLRTPNQSKQLIIVRDSLRQADKQTLYYRTQYLKANGQLIEIKKRIISNEIIIN